MRAHVHYSDDSVTLYQGDAAAVLASFEPESVHCCVTSPPYFGLRDYGVDGQLGLEASPAEYVAGLVAVFEQVRRVLRSDGTLWLNLGDSYSGQPGGPQGSSGDRASRTFTAEARGGWGDRPAKNLLGIPWRVAFALQDAGWTLRNAIVWHKPNAMPESVTDRLSTTYELVFLLSKSRTYAFDLDAIREGRSEATEARYSYAFKADDHAKHGTGLRGGFMTKASELGKNPGDVWTIPTSPFAAAHFATMPPALAERCILAGSPAGGTVLDPFSGSGTTGYAATRLGRRYVGIDLNPEYLELSLKTRLAQAALIEAGAVNTEKALFGGGA